ncbi:hypothetical protein Q4596_01165 [Pseudoalteromonas carrageenovora]|uniref:hypothetical protein n=1 Tax=Pseudoalteromonas carrageenovora TaxID=227 RepID=UPI0026E2BBAA|nr:hypothetical protein [Pseudoalteromonas carrageenovora]MDO6834208.1 hypothetical protein [Pseudoalteromonas carrageenovora]
MFISLLKPEYGYYGFLFIALLTLYGSIEGYLLSRKEKIRDKSISDNAKKMNISLEESMQQNNTKYRKELAQRGGLKTLLISIYETSSYLFVLFLLIFPFILAAYIPIVLFLVDNYFYQFFIYFIIWVAYFFLFALYLKLNDSGGILLITGITAFVGFFLASSLAVAVRWLMGVI